MKCFIKWLDGSCEAVAFKTVAEARKALATEARPMWSTTWATGVLVALITNFKGETVDTAVVSPEGRVILCSSFKTGHVGVKVDGGRITVDPRGRGFIGFRLRKGTPGVAEIMLLRRGVFVLTSEGEHWDTFDL